MPTDEQVWKMLDAWYQLLGRAPARTAGERDIDFAAMRRHLAAFETDMAGKQKAA